MKCEIIWKMNEAVVRVLKIKICILNIKYMYILSLNSVKNKHNIKIV